MDSDLIAAARQGDETACQLIIDRHREAVFRLAYLLLGDPDAAHDVAQETFIRAFRALGRFDSSRPLRPWLLKIASNLARNRSRALGRYWAAVSRFVQHIPESSYSAEAEAVRQDEAVELWQAVRKLNTPEQEIIYLRFYLELSVEETADVLHVAPGTVKSRLHRALKRLRFVIEREFPLLVEEYEQ